MRRARLGGMKAGAGPLGKCGVFGPICVIEPPKAGVNHKGECPNSKKTRNLRAGMGKTRKLFPTASVFSFTTSNPSMKSILKLSLAAMLLGLPVANLLCADDQAPPVQSGPSIQPDQPPPPNSGEKPQHQHVMNPQRMLQMLTKKLDLTDDQQAKILPILQAQADQLKALRGNDSLSDDDKRDQMRAIMQSTRKQIGDLLTPEQKEKFKNMRGGEHAHDNPPPPPDAPPPSTDNAPPANNPPPADNAPPPAN